MDFRSMAILKYIVALIVLCLIILVLLGWISHDEKANNIFYAVSNFGNPAACVFPLEQQMDNAKLSNETSFVANVSTDNNKPNLAVAFRDTSVNSPVCWDWSFIDWGNQTKVPTHFDTLQYPDYTFGAGNFSIMLTTRNASGFMASSYPMFINISAGKVRPGLSLEGFRAWPSDHIFNTPIVNLPLDPKSSVYIGNMTGGCVTAYLYFGKFLPLNIADSNITKTPLLGLTHPERPHTGVLFPIPDYAKVEEHAGTDHAMWIFDPDANTIDNLYAAYEPRQPNGTYLFSQAEHYDLSGYDLGPIGSRTDPPPLRYDEAVAGNITHVMAVAVVNTQSANIWPGVQGDGNYPNTEYPPIGERFRLRQDFDVSAYTPMQQHILNGLKNYGMIVTDNIRSNNIFAIIAENNPNWDFDYSTFSNVTITDFEAIDESSLMISKNSGKVNGALGH